MASKPTVGGSDGSWGTELNAFLDVSFNADGTIKSSLFGLTGYTIEDDDLNDILKDHAYLATSDGYVYAEVSLTSAGQHLNGYVGSTNDPAGAGARVGFMEAAAANVDVSIFFAVGEGEFFEITSGSGTPVIRWKSIGPQSKPTDQD